MIHPLIDRLVDENLQVRYLAAQLYTKAEYTKWDIAEIQKIAEGYARADIEKLIIQHLGGLSIRPESMYTANQVKTDLTLEDFRKIYEFGKYPSAKQWIVHIYSATGKHVSIRELYEYILVSTGEESRPSDKRVRYRANVY